MCWWPVKNNYFIDGEITNAKVSSSAIEVEGNNLENINISNNYFKNLKGEGIGFNPGISNVLNININNNSFCNIKNGYIGEASYTGFADIINTNIKISGNSFNTNCDFISLSFNNSTNISRSVFKGTFRANWRNIPMNSTSKYPVNICIS